MATLETVSNLIEILKTSGSPLAELIIAIALIIGVLSPLIKSIIRSLFDHISNLSRARKELTKNSGDPISQRGWKNYIAILEFRKLFSCWISSKIIREKICHLYEVIPNVTRNIFKGMGDKIFINSENQLALKPLSRREVISSYFFKGLSIFSLSLAILCVSIVLLITLLAKLLDQNVFIIQVYYLIAFAFFFWSKLMFDTLDIKKAHHSIQRHIKQYNEHCERNPNESVQNSNQAVYSWKG